MGIAAGFLSIVFFVAEVALYLTFIRPVHVAADGSPGQDPPRSRLAEWRRRSNEPGNAASYDARLPSTTSTVTTVGNITVVDVALGISSLSSEFVSSTPRRRPTESACCSKRRPPPARRAKAWPPRCPIRGCRTALDHVRLVRVDREPFEEDLAELQIPSRPFPGFSCSTPTCA